MTTMQRYTIRAMVALIVLSLIFGNNAMGKGCAVLAMFCFAIIAIGVIVDVFVEIFK